MTPRQQRQTVTFEIDLRRDYTGGRAEANEIIITTADGRSKGYGLRDLEQAVKRESYRSVDVAKIYAAIETLAEWAAKGDGWEYVE